MSTPISARLTEEKLQTLKQALDKLNLTYTKFINMMVDIFLSRYKEKDDVNIPLQHVNSRNNNIPYQTIIHDIDELLDGLKQNWIKNYYMIYLYFSLSKLFIKSNVELVMT